MATVVPGRDFVSILDRVLLLILALGTLAVSIFGFIVGLGVAPGWIATVANELSFYPVNVYVIVLTLIFAVIALRFIFYRIGQVDSDYVTLSGENGNIRISYDTVRDLANRTGKLIRGVQDFDTRVRSGQAGILLAVRVRVLPDIDLAELSGQIQQKVKSYVEKTCGINVERITVNITELAQTGNKSAKTWVE
ncbi:alkaline shock response membrane anchor protein AmaP [Alicyclobacillaceae bacterium I2511]|nr:alkaline shock response membrane anchor protein AmaP [Alicyclobacillaceae bacterium I2511]